MRRLVAWGVVAVVVGGLAIQLVPYGRDHDNPAVVAEPSWDSGRTRDLVSAACVDCHSNETRWPWYTNVAPMSWLVTRDVAQGREALNFSRWDLEQDEAEDAAETVVDGEMPPRRYTLAHPSARLSDEDREALARGLAATLGGDADD